MPSSEPWLEHVPMPAYLFRISGGDDFTLEAVSAITRTQHPEITRLFGRSMIALYADQPQAIEDARRCVREQTVVRRETPMRRYDHLGTNQRLQLTYVPLPPDRMVIYSHELAPTSAAEAALRESEERHRSLVASLPVGLLFRDAKGVVVATNDVAVELLGHQSQADLLGRVDIVPPGYRVIAEEGGPVPFEELPSSTVLSHPGAGASRLLGLVAPDGSTRWARVSAEVVRGDDGAVRGAVSTLTEVTDRIAAQEALRENAARLNLALEAARMGSWEFDVDANAVLWSENLGRLFHFKPGENSRDTFVARIHPDDRAHANEKSLRFLAEGKDGDLLESEYRVLGDDGVHRWGRFTSRLFRQGGRTRMAGTAMDVTERRRLEDQLRLATRLESLGRLAGGVAHDFNNLLAAMLGSLDLIDEHAPVELKDDLGTVRQGAERARDLTQQLLAFARRRPVKLEVIDLGALVLGVERMLRRLVGENIELVVRCPESASVKADPAQLEQALVNLAVNARDAMRAGGRLEVRLGRSVVPGGAAVPPGDYAVIDVIDTGAGMDEETRRQAFDPFFTTKESGTGLGLASTYGTVQQHGGHLLIESEPGRGSTFRMYLPRVETAPRAPAAAPKDATVPHAGVVMVVDDNPMVRKSSVRMLQRLGYQVLSAGGGAEALELARTQPFDCVVCDVSMPGMTGPELATALVAARPDVHVIFVSGYPPGPMGDTAPPSQFLQKPFSISQLASTLREAFGTG